MLLPSAVVLSCGEKDSLDLVKQISGESVLPAPVAIVDSIKGYPWHIETKYYTADINLCTFDEKSLGNSEFAENVQAAVIYFDSDVESSFAKVQEWMVFIDEFSPEVKLLVCEKMSTENAVVKNDVQQWCLKKNFELVELNPDVDVDTDVEDDFRETTGIQRIIQALHAHLWPNLEMKEQGSGSSTFARFLQASDNDQSDDALLDGTETIDKSLADLSIAPTEGAEMEQPSSTASMQSENSEAPLLEEIDLSNFMPTDELEGSQSFETLFERFQLMKDKAKDLPFEDRKAYAEKVVLAFWNAIGGDEDEITGLEDE